MPDPRPDAHADDLDARLARSLRPIAFVLGVMYLTSVVHRAADPHLLATTAPTAIVPAVLFLVLGTLFCVRPLPASLGNPVLVLALGFMAVETLGRGEAAAGVNLHWALIGLGAVVLRPRWAAGAVAAVVVPWAVVAALRWNGWALDHWAFSLDMATATALGLVIYVARRRDVLEALRAEAELVGSRARYRRLMAVLRDGVVRLDGAGRIVRMNPRAEWMLGVPEQAAIGLTGRTAPWSYLDGAGRPMAPEAMPSAVVAATGRPVTDSLIGLVRADGSRTWVMENAAPGRLDASGRPEEIIVSLTDVTALRDALESVSRSEARVREVVDSARDLILLVDERGLVSFANPAVARETGYPVDGIVGGPVLRAVDVRDRAVAREALAAVDQGEVVREVRVRRAAGPPLWVEVRAHRLPGGTLQLIARDITLRRALEAERDELEAKLARAARMEAIGQLAGGVAHDFNNLLTAILGHAELAADEAHGRPELQADLREITRAGERAQTLTRQLLAFGRRSLLRPRPVDLEQVAAGLEPMLRRLIGEDVALVVEPAASPHTVVADPGLLEHAIVNLVVNARDAMPGGGLVRITTGGAEPADDVPVGDWAAIRVHDTGPGIPADILDRVFEPFFSTKPIGQGTGLGLAMVHGFVDQSGGHIRIRTAPETGTRVSILLPVADSLAAPEPARPDAVAAGSGTILVAEDEAVLRAIAERTLRLAGYRVLTAESGEAAVRIADEHPGEIDLLFTDIVMPGIHGLALARALRARHDGLRVLVTSGYTEDDVMRRGVSVPDLPFLPKPYTPSALASAVAAILG